MPSDPYPFQASLSWLEQILKVAGLLAAFGYVALRSHLARLGVTSATPFGIERYLSEFYTMLSDILLRAMIALILVVPVLLLGICCAAVFKRTKGIWLVVRRRKEIFGAAALNPWLPAALLLSLVLMTLWMLRQVSAILDSVAVVGGLKDVSRASATGAHVFEVIFWGVLAAGFLCWGVSWASSEPGERFSEGAARLLWKVCNVFVLVLVLHVPLLYGAFAHETKYPSVSITSEKGTTTCGLLVLQTSNDYRIWQTTGSVGRLVIVPNGQVSVISAGLPVDIVDSAAKAARGEKTQYCPE